VTATDPKGRSVTAAVLAAADGIWSAVRAALIPDCVPRFAGATATRTVLPAGEAGPLATQTVGVWLNPTAHVVHYPVRGGREIAVVVIASEAGQDRGADRGPGRALERNWDAHADPDRLRRRLAPFHASLTDTLLPGPGRDRAWREWSLNTLPELPAWAHRRIVLLGDAAHPMLPYLAQGGALALEDAVVLAAGLATATDPVAALARFHADRAARACRVQAASVRQGRVYRLAQPLSWARDAALALVPGARLMAGYDWLYAWHPPPAEAFADAKRPEG
jgi:salicylate hydroxylase